MWYLMGPMASNPPPANDPDNAEPTDQNPEGGNLDPAALANAAKAARAEAATWRSKAREYEKQVNDLKGAGQSELERVTSRATAAEQRVSELEAAQLRLEVGIAKGLPLTLVRRLTGSSREEIEADADELLKIAAPGPRPRQIASGDTAGVKNGGQGPGAKPEDANNWLRGKLTARS